jgi:hypothetical protein
MRGAVLYAPNDIRVDDGPDPRIVEPTDAVIRLSASSSAVRPGSSKKGGLVSDLHDRSTYRRSSARTSDLDDSPSIGAPVVSQLLKDGL